MEATPQRGRKPLDPDERRDVQFKLKVSPVERKLLDDVAEVVPKPLTVWAREVLLNAAKRVLK